MIVSHWILVYFEEEKLIDWSYFQNCARCYYLKPFSDFIFTFLIGILKIIHALDSKLSKIMNAKLNLYEFGFAPV